jgi:hypothetical protein
MVVIALEARPQPYSLEHTVHTNPRSAFARGDRLAPEDISLGEEARQVLAHRHEQRAAARAADADAVATQGLSLPARERPL